MSTPQAPMEPWEFLRRYAALPPMTIEARMDLSSLQKALGVPQGMQLKEVQYDAPNDQVVFSFQRLPPIESFATMGEGVTP